MAKKPVPAADSAQQEEMTVMVMRFKGSPATLQKGFDTVSQAIATLGGAARVISARVPANLPAPPDVIDAEASANGNGAGPEALEPEVEEVASPAVGAKPKKPAAIKYSFLADFNLTPESVPSLKEFCEPKNAETEQDRYLVVCLWLQTHGSADPFTGNQVFTCFRGLGWTPRKDVMQPVREMKSRRSWFDSPSYGKWRLTQPGVEAAEAVGQA